MPQKETKRYGYGDGYSSGEKYRMEIDMHLDSLEIEQDSTFHSID